MCKLCFGTLLTILTNYKVTVTDEQICSNIFRLCKDIIDQSLTSRLKVCERNIPSTIMVYYTKLSIEEMISDVNDTADILIKQLLSNNDHKNIVICLLDLLKEDTSIDSGTTVGYDNAYKKELLLNSKEFVLKDVLSNFLYYVIYNAQNKQENNKYSINEKLIASKKDSIKLVDYVDDCKAEPTIDKTNTIEFDGQKRQLSKKYKTITPVSGLFYCERKYVTDKITALFDNSNTVFVSGVSGSGKSEVCRKYASDMLKQGKINNVIPLRLNEDGSGDLSNLASQIILSDQSPAETTGLSFISRVFDENDLILLDNYNSLDNNVILELRNYVPTAKLLVTSQLLSDEMLDSGKVIELEKLTNLHHNNFASYIFCSYAKLNINELSESDLENIDLLTKIVGYHTMISEHLGRQFKSLGISIEEFTKLCCGTVADAIGIDLDVSSSKDNININLSPKELVFTLFKNKIIFNKFTPLQRQVLGAIILCEKYTSNSTLICNLIGDSNELNLHKAKSCMNRLRSNGIISYENDNVYIHPLIKTLLDGSTPTNDYNDTIADVGYDYLIHLTKNKLIETYSIKHPESVASVIFKENDKWQSWVLDIVGNTILPKMIEQDTKLKSLIEDEFHYIVNPVCKTGASIYIHFDSGKEICVLDASENNIKENRYYNGFAKHTNNKSFDRAIILMIDGKTPKDLDIPNRMCNAPVVKLGFALFKENHTIKNVTLPKTLEAIPDYAFCNCSNLVSVKMPDSVQSIGTRAFYNCRKLKEINLSKNLNYISIAAFSNCINMTGDIILNEGLEVLHRFAFYACHNIKKVVLPDSMTDIGQSIFEDCISLKTVTVGRNIPKFPRELFNNCQSLEEIHIPSSVKTVDEYVFNNCKSLTKVTMDDGVKIIRGHAFYNCESLKLVSLPDSINYIDFAAITDCPNAIVEFSADSRAEKNILRANTEGHKFYRYRYK